MAPLSGVKPRATNGSQKVASSAATVTSAATASWNPSPAAQPRTTQTTGTCAEVISPISRWAVCGTRRWMLPARGRSSPALRATMSAPEQKWSPAPVSTTARTRSSRSASLMASAIPVIITSSTALRLSGLSSVSRRTASSSSTPSPGTPS